MNNVTKLSSKPVKKAPKIRTMYQICKMIQTASTGLEMKLLKVKNNAAAIAHLDKIAALVEELKAAHHWEEDMKLDMTLPKSATKRDMERVPALYKDNKGNHWSGRGKMPQWLVGKNQDDFLIK